MRPKLTYFTEFQLDKLKEISELSGLSVSELVRRGVDLFINATNRANSPDCPVTLSGEKDEKKHEDVSRD